MLASIKGIRKYFYGKALYQRQQQVRIPHQSVHWTQAKRIGLLFDGTLPQHRQFVLDYARQLERQQKKVTLLGFIDQSKPLPDLPFPHYTQQNINWKLEPFSEQINNFSQRNFDVLWVLSTISNLQFEYIATLSNAKFRIGPLTANIEAYDLMIDSAQTASLSAFIQQTEEYLQKAIAVM